MRWRHLLLLLCAAAFASGCPETVRCDDGEVFDEDGECGPIPPDAGPADAGPADAGPADAGPANRDGGT